MRFKEVWITSAKSIHGQLKQHTTKLVNKFQALYLECEADKENAKERDTG